MPNFGVRRETRREILALTFPVQDENFSGDLKYTELSFFEIPAPDVWPGRDRRMS